MSEKQTHETVVGGQFGSRADAYLKSAVHSAGEDLQALVAVAAERARGKILDLGCGGGHVTFNVAPHASSVTAYDLSQEMLDVVAGAARDRGLANVKTSRGVAESLPFEDASFDLVMSRYSAHHWHDVDAAMREAFRVLKPGGTLAITDSISPGRPLLDTFYQTIEMLRDCSHVRNYSRVEWQSSIARAGFVSGEARQFRLRLDFASWVERMRTPQVQVEAIRALQRTVSETATAYFETEGDGSFTFDVGFFRAARP